VTPGMARLTPLDPWVAFNIYSVYRNIYVTSSLPCRKSAINSVFYVFPVPLQHYCSWALFFLCPRLCH